MRHRAHHEAQQRAVQLAVARRDLAAAGPALCTGACSLLQAAQ